ncbi:MAG: nucleotidyltransferase domain-containing protein [Thermoleophilia bacterium]|nr:nucleotidyltransferase domain-containing protein [Thermoleophilia bacterium]
MARSIRGGIQDPILAEAVRRLVEVYAPNFVYLFGSSARGDRDDDSDYDLLVVVSDSAPEELRRAGRGYEALWGLGASVDVVVGRAYRLRPAPAPSGFSAGHRGARRPPTACSLIRSEQKTPGLGWRGRRPT